ncbi:hypothetical protein HPB48_000662 [Haemaphysalis longicornis]|uniref:Uncharacterized protein n=1 Tax=Haemaphysalis longicornis TaxID=44386 RepID=A0A9J6FBK3_HAELO|nr:hypothetical protein HPB48_000662 [Haemaphysalis longicornis]
MLEYGADKENQAMHPTFAFQVSHFQDVALQLELENFPVQFITRFKKRHGIAFKTVAGEAASLDTAAKEKSLVEKLPNVLSPFEEKDIYRADEKLRFSTTSFPGRHTH